MAGKRTNPVYPGVASAYAPAPLAAARPSNSMFNICECAASGGVISSNAHPESEYIMDPARMIDSTTPLHRQVCNQVYGGSGAAVSFSSAVVDPRKPAGWPTTTDLFSALTRPSKR